MTESTKPAELREKNLVSDYEQMAFKADSPVVRCPGGPLA